jgi:hypothetical protein
LATKNSLKVETVLPMSLPIFDYEKLTITILDTTNGYGVIQCVLGFLVNECANRQDREYPHIVNLLLSEEAMNFKAMCTALVSPLKIERVDGHRREAICCSKKAADAILSPPLV